MTDDELTEGLKRLSKKTGWSLTELVYMARIIGQADIDPLPPADWGEPFDFPQDKISVTGDDVDFDPINPEVPPPDAQVVLTYAWHEWKKDVVSMSNIYSRGRHLTFDQHWWCFRHFWDWARFWAVRHTDPEARAEFVLFLQQYDEAGARIVEKARDHLRKHGLSETQIEQGLE